MFLGIIDNCDTRRLLLITQIVCWLVSVWVIWLACTESRSVRAIWLACTESRSVRAIWLDCTESRSVGEVWLAGREVGPYRTLWLAGREVGPYRTLWLAGTEVGLYRTLWLAGTEVGPYRTIWLDDFFSRSWTEQSNWRLRRSVFGRLRWTSCFSNSDSSSWTTTKWYAKCVLFCMAIAVQPANACKTNKRPSLFYITYSTRGGFLATYMIRHLYNWNILGMELPALVKSRLYIIISWYFKQNCSTNFQWGRSFFRFS